MVRVIFASLLVFSSIAGADSKTYTVKGMHCGECKKSIEAKVCNMPGLESCKVEMGEVTLMSKNPLDDTQVKKAVASAGSYKVTSTKPAHADAKTVPDAPAATDAAPAK